MALSYAIPRIESAIITNGGTMSRDWYLFFSALLQTVGGPDVVSGGGIAPSDVQRQFEEYAVTSLEAVDALRGVVELRNEMERGDNTQIQDLLRAVDELRNELASTRQDNATLRGMYEELNARLAVAPNNDLRNRVEALEDRLA